MDAENIDTGRNHPHFKVPSVKSLDFGETSMNICVVGLWHLGTVTAACLASAGFKVVGLDFDPEVVRSLQEGRPPVFEPDLAELVQQGIAKNQLRFSADPADALAEAEIVWIAYDTPVDEEDRADVEFVVDRVIRIFPHIGPNSLILVSSQLPAGSVRRLEEECARRMPDRSVSFGCSPENLRLGKAIAAFTKPDRVVVGLRNAEDRSRVSELLAPFTANIEWISVESAEMAKHALNAFLATSVTFINEIASICERAGADAKEVERALKSDIRIGPRAYLSPGSAFAGGTLARDIRFLTQLGAAHQLPPGLFPAVQASNEAHKKWNQRTLSFLFPKLAGLKIGIWGLTYKAGTDTLRRSSSVELCQWLFQQGALPQVHDPAINILPKPLNQIATLHSTPESVLVSAAALVIATEWPIYRSVPTDAVERMASPIVLDANRFLGETIGRDSRVRYFTVGKASR
jgi:UDPglucose 6-dehydrogenase